MPRIGAVIGSCPTGGRAPGGAGIRVMPPGPLLSRPGGAVSFVSSIRDYTFTSALGSISARFEPDEAAALDLGPAIAVALAWVVVLMVPGVVRFLRSDFK